MLDEEQFATDNGARRVLEYGAASGRLTHLERLPERSGRRVAWPGWVPADVMKAFALAGIAGPWAHQAAAADLAHAGHSVIMATGTASGKSIGYLAPALTAVTNGWTALYLAPTRALAADQLTLLRSLSGQLRPRLHAAVVDSDTPASERMRARKHATYLLTTPDMLHYSLLPQHQRWDAFFRRLRYVIVDECHGYRGVFGSHVAQVLRRLRRVAAHHGAAIHGRGGDDLRFILASATISEPARCAELLTGRCVQAVTADAAPRGPMTFGMWEPPLTGLRGEAGAPLRRSVIAEAADLLADLVLDGTPSLAFIRPRRGA